MEGKVKILVVEDEMVIGAKIAMFLNELGYEVSAILPRAEDALDHVAKNPPDLALLDIRLQGPMDGIALAETLQSKYGIPVVFLTANADEATFNRAKTANPFAFLQKPFRKIELQSALALALKRMAAESDTAESPTLGEQESETFLLDDRIFVRYNEKMIKLMFDDILHVEADRSYCRIVTSDKEYLLTMPMKKLGDKLPETAFQRIHRSHIVNLYHVEEVADGMVRIAGQMLPLSPALREAFLKRFRTV